MASPTIVDRPSDDDSDLEESDTSLMDQTAIIDARRSSRRVSFAPTASIRYSFIIFWSARELILAFRHFQEFLSSADTPKEGPRLNLAHEDSLLTGQEESSLKLDMSTADLSASALELDEGDSRDFIDGESTFTTEEGKKDFLASSRRMSIIWNPPKKQRLADASYLKSTVQDNMELTQVISSNFQDVDQLNAPTITEEPEKDEGLDYGDMEFTQTIPIVSRDTTVIADEDVHKHNSFVQEDLQEQAGMEFTQVIPANLNELSELHEKSDQQSLEYTQVVSRLCEANVVPDSEPLKCLPQEMVREEMELTQVIPVIEQEPGASEQVAFTNNDHEGQMELTQVISSLNDGIFPQISNDDNPLQSFEHSYHEVDEEVSFAIPEDLPAAAVEVERIDDLTGEASFFTAIPSSNEHSLLDTINVTEAHPRSPDSMPVPVGEDVLRTGSDHIIPRTPTMLRTPVTVLPFLKDVDTRLQAPVAKEDLSDTDDLPLDAAKMDSVDSTPLASRTSIMSPLSERLKRHPGIGSPLKSAPRTPTSRPNIGSPIRTPKLEVASSISSPLATRLDNTSVQTPLNFAVTGNDLQLDDEQSIETENASAKRTGRKRESLIWDVNSPVSITSPPVKTQPSAPTVVVQEAAVSLIRTPVKPTEQADRTTEPVQVPLKDSPSNIGTAHTPTKWEPFTTPLQARIKNLTGEPVNRSQDVILSAQNFVASLSSPPGYAHRTPLKSRVFKGVAGNSSKDDLSFIGEMKAPEAFESLNSPVVSRRRSSINYSVSSANSTPNHTANSVKAAISDKSLKLTEFLSLAGIRFLDHLSALKGRRDTFVAHRQSISSFPPAKAIATLLIARPECEFLDESNTLLEAKLEETQELLSKYEHQFAVYPPPIYQQLLESPKAVSVSLKTLKTSARKLVMQDWHEWRLAQLSSWETVLSANFELVRSENSSITRKLQEFRGLKGDLVAFKKSLQEKLATLKERQAKSLTTDWDGLAKLEEALMEQEKSMLKLRESLTTKKASLDALTMSINSLSLEKADRDAQVLALSRQLDAFRDLSPLDLEFIKSKYQFVLKCLPVNKIVSVNPSCLELECLHFSYSFQLRVKLIKALAFEIELVPLQYSLLFTKFTHSILPSLLRPFSKSLKNLSKALAFIFTNLETLSALEKEFQILQCLHSVAILSKLDVPKLGFTVTLLNQAKQAKLIVDIILTPQASLQQVEYSVLLRDSYNVKMEQKDIEVILEKLYPNPMSLTAICEELSAIL